MERLTGYNSFGDVYGIGMGCGNNTDVIYAIIKRLSEYENTGLSPQEIEQMKARMPLHQWAGESPDKMSIFSMPVSKIIELVKAEKEGRLIVLASDKDQLRILKDRCKICPYWNGKSYNKT